MSYLTGAESTGFASEPTDFMTLIPTVYNADALGIRPDLIEQPVTSWAELLNPRSGRRTFLSPAGQGKLLPGGLVSLSLEGEAGRRSRPAGEDAGKR